MIVNKVGQRNKEKKGNKNNSQPSHHKSITLSMYLYFSY